MRTTSITSSTHYYGQPSFGKGGRTIKGLGGSGNNSAVPPIPPIKIGNGGGGGGGNDDDDNKKPNNNGGGKKKSTFTNSEKAGFWASCGFLGMGFLKTGMAGLGVTGVSYGARKTIELLRRKR